MNIKEIVKQIAEETNRAERTNELLKKEQIKLVKELESTINKHFRGVEVRVMASESKLKVLINDNTVLYHTYNKTSFYNITRKLAYKIIEEYESVYGEIEKEQDNCHATLTQTLCNNDLIDATRYATNVLLNNEY